MIIHARAPQSLAPGQGVCGSPPALLLSPSSCFWTVLAAPRRAQAQPYCIQPVLLTQDAPAPPRTPNRPRPCRRYWRMCAGASKGRERAQRFAAHHALLPACVAVVATAARRTCRTISHHCCCSCGLASSAPKRGIANALSSLSGNSLLSHTQRRQKPFAKTTGHRGCSARLASLDLAVHPVQQARPHACGQEEQRAQSAHVACALGAKARAPAEPRTPGSTSGCSPSSGGSCAASCAQGGWPIPLPRTRPSLRSDTYSPRSALALVVRLSCWVNLRARGGGPGRWVVVEPAPRARLATCEDASTPLAHQAFHWSRPVAAARHLRSSLAGPATAAASLASGSAAMVRATRSRRGARLSPAVQVVRP